MTFLKKNIIMGIKLWYVYMTKFLQNENWLDWNMYDGPTTCIIIFMFNGVTQRTGLE